MELMEEKFVPYSGKITHRGKPDSPKGLSFLQGT